MYAPARPAPAARAGCPARLRRSTAGRGREHGSGIRIGKQGAVSGLANRVVVSDAKERTPEKMAGDIRKLKTEGKAIEAERELAEFKKRYPDYILPEDLR